MMASQQQQQQQSNQQQQQPELSLDILATQGLRNIRQLRQQTKKTFEFLRDGIQPHGDDVISDDQIFTKDSKQFLLTIMETFDQLEKITTMLPKQPNPNFGGNLNYLMQNTITEGPFTSVSATDGSTPMPYEQVLGAYNWLQRSNEFSQLSSIYLGQYVRRNQSKLFRRPPTVNGWSIQQLNQQLLPACQKLVPGIQINTIPRGRNTVLIFVTVCAISTMPPPPLQSPLLKIVILARANPFTLEWANVKGADEDFYDDNGKLDLHAPSRYKVFQKLSNHVKGALLYHMSMMNNPPGQYLQQYLKTFFMWLGMYRNLFTDPCVNCKRILRDYLPPYCRDYRKIDHAYHEACK